VTTFGKNLIESACEALAIAEGAPPARILDAQALDVFALRQRLGLTQDKFAKRFGLSLATLQDWEQGRRHPDRMAQNLLRIIAYAPETVERALANSKR
jgi:putative transcriptional regulator